MATEPRLVRPRVLVGARRAGHDHAARPLAGDEGDRPGPAARSPRSPSCCPTRPSVVDGDGDPRRCRVDELRVGDVVLVRPGGRVPADGAIVDGAAELDESMITGESRPVAEGGRRPGGRRHGVDRLVDPGAGRRGRRRHRAGRHPAPRRRGPGQPQPGPGARRPVRRAAVLRRRRRRRSSRSSCGAALGDLDEAVVRTVTVLVIACPHALGLAIPLVIALSTAVAARAGILVKDRLALERMRTVDTVLFDKTGTLTKGAHVVTGVAGADGSTTDEVLRLAGGRRGRQRAPARPGDRRRGRDATAPSPRPRTSGRSPAAASRPTVDGAALRGRRAGAAARARRSTCPPSSPAPIDGWEQPRRRRAVPRPRRRGRRRARARGRGPPRGRARPSTSSTRLGVARGDDHRRRPPGRRRRRPPSSASTRCSPRCCPRTRTAPSPSCRAAA